MLRTRLALFVLVSAPALPVAAAPQGSVATPEAMARLVPADAFAFSRLSSIRDFETSARGLIAAIDPSYDALFDVRELLNGTFKGRVDLNQVDWSKPVGVALSLQPGSMEPVPTFIVPVMDTKRFVESVPVLAGQAAPIALGEYVGISLGSDYMLGTKPNSFAQGLPYGQLSLRIDIERLVEAFGPIIDMGLAQAEAQMEQVVAMQGSALQAQGAPPMMDLEEFLGVYLEWVRAMVDSAEECDLGIAVNGTEVEITGGLKVLAGSVLDGFGGKPHGSLRELARYLDPEAALSFAAAADLARMLDRVAPMIELAASVYPVSSKLAVRDYVAGFAEVYRTMGNAVAGDGTMDENGLRYTYFFRPADAPAMVSAYAARLRSSEAATFGLAVSAPVERLVDGTTVTEFRFALPAEAAADSPASAVESGSMRELARTVYGAEPRLAFAVRGETVALVFGGDDAYLQRAIERLSAASGAPLGGPLQRALDACANASPAFVGSMDLSLFLSQVAPVISTLVGDQVPDLAPLADISVPLRFFGGIEGRTWRSGVSFDIAAFKRFGELAKGL